MIIEFPEKVVFKYKGGRTLVLTPSDLRFSELERLFFVEARCYITKESLHEQKSIPEKDKQDASSL